MPQGEPLVREVQLDTQPAQQALSELASQVEAIFSQASDQISAALVSGIEGAAATPIALDTESIPGEISGAIESADAPPIALEGDASAIPEEIAGAVDGADVPAVALEADTEAIPDEISAAVSGAQVPIVPIQGDNTDAIAAVDEVVSEAENADATVQIGADTTDAQQGIEGVGDAAKGSGAGVNVLGGAISGLTTKLSAAADTTGATGGALAALGPEAILAAGAVTTAAIAGEKIVKTGAEVIGTLQQFHTTFGRFAEDARTIDVAGLNDDLGDLAVSLGVDDEAALGAEARVGAFAQTLGLGQQQSAKFSKEVAAIAASVTSANPSLGTLDSVMARIAQTLARNPSGLRRLGIEVTPAEIDALATKLGKIPESLSQGEKAALAVQIALKKVGDASDEVAARQKNAQVTLAATNERLKNLFEAFAVPIAEPLLKQLEALGPAVKGLEPLFKGLGIVLAGTLLASTKALEALELAFGETISSIGKAIEKANSLPGLGHLIPDKLGPDLQDFGNNLIDAGKHVTELDFSSKAAGDSQATFGTAIDGSNEALAAQAQVTPEAQQALDDYQASVDASTKAAEDFQKQVDGIADASVSALPTTKDAFDSWQTGIHDAFQRVVDDQGKVKDAFDRAHAATTNTGLQDAVKDYRAASKDLSAARTELEAASDPKTFLQNLLDQAAGIANFTKNLTTLLGRGETDLVDKLASLGPVVGGQLAQQLVNEPAIADSTNKAIGLLNAATEQQKQFMENDAGPRIAASAAKVAQDASDAYSKTLNFRIPTQEELGVTADTINTDRRVSDETHARAFSASREWGTAFTVAGRTRAELSKTATAISTDTTLPTAAKQHGEALGVDFGLGIAQGFTNALPTILAGGDHAIHQLDRGMRRTSGAQSPAKLFALLGDDIASGVALGLTRSSPEAEAAGSALVTNTRDAMVSPAAQIPGSPALTPALAPAGAGATAGAGAAGAPRVVVQGPLVGAVNNNADPAHIAAELAWKLP